MQKFFNYMISVSKNDSVILNFKFMREVYMSLRRIKNNKHLFTNLRMSVLEYY